MQGCSEIWTVLPPLLGVCVGFVLAEGTRCLHGRIRIRRLKKLLREELASILRMMPHKQDGIERVRLGLERQLLLQGGSHHFLTSGYRAHFTEVYEYLTPVQRDCLHIIYERISFLDEKMDVLHQEVIDAMSKEIMADPCREYVKVTKDLLDSLAPTKRLITSYLDGNPINPFSDISKSS